MSEAEEDLLREEVLSVYQTLALTADVIEAAERHLGPSNWDIEGAGERAAPAVSDAELSEAEMREVLNNMREDLRSALEVLRRYAQHEDVTRATIMLGFMVKGSILRIEKVLNR
jgi:hypothetical protein